MLHFGGSQLVTLQNGRQVCSGRVRKKLFSANATEHLIGHRITNDVSLSSIINGKQFLCIVFVVGCASDCIVVGTHANKCSSSKTMNNKREISLIS